MASTVCLLPRTLKEGMRGNDVVAMKRALSRAGYGTWKGMLFTKLFGDSTVTLLKRFQMKNKLRVDGQYGPVTHKKLAKFYDAYGMKLMNDMATARKQLKEPAARMVAAALEIYNYCHLTGHGTYTQGNRRMSIVKRRWRPPFSRDIWLYEDCSSSVTGISWIAKIPDPNHLGYSGYGYTGTLSVHGRRVSTPTPACFGFYGYRWPYKHTVMYLHNGLVFSWGSGLPKILRWNYRSDLNHWRGGYA